jgi:iron(III) transport system permease protein
VLVLTGGWLILVIAYVVRNMILVWITAASELSSTIVLYTSCWSTMTVRMYHFLEGGEGAGSASAAAILILFTAAPLLLIHRRVRRQDDAML